MNRNIFQQVARALFNRQVPLSHKLLFLVLVLGYTLMPLDILPINVLDDLVVAWLASLLFLRITDKYNQRQSKYDNGDVIDVEGDILE